MEYWQTIGEVNLKDLIFLDEADSNLAMTRRYARSEKGNRAYSQAPGKRGKNVIMIRALSWAKGFIAPMTWHGGTDGLAFRTYVEEILVPTLWEGACVVMDNFSAHHVEGIREAIEAVGAQLVYLPPTHLISRQLKTAGPRSKNHSGLKQPAPMIRSTRRSPTP